MHSAAPALTRLALADVCVSAQALERFVAAVKDVQARTQQGEAEADANKARAGRTADECQRVCLRALALAQELVQHHRLQCVVSLPLPSVD